MSEMRPSIAEQRGWKPPPCGTCRKRYDCFAWLEAHGIVSYAMDKCTLFEYEDIPIEYFEAGGT